MLTFSSRQTFHDELSALYRLADPKIDTGDSHAPVPFYVTTEGFGILVDTARYAAFYFGDAQSKPVRASKDAGHGTNPDPNYTHTVKENESSHIVIDVPNAAGVDLYLFAGPDMLNAVKRYNVYLKAAFQRYAEDGTPPFRALVLDTPNDKRLHKVDDQYLIGDRMMVAPLFAGEPSRKVVLPSGVWHNFWTGEAHNGDVEITVPAASEKIPVYVKAGSIVPWAEVGPHAGSPASRRLTARVYGDGSLPFQSAGDKGKFRLTWTGDHGSVEGDAGSFNISAWQRIDRKNVHISHEASACAKASAQQPSPGPSYIVVRADQS